MMMISAMTNERIAAKIAHPFATNNDDPAFMKKRIAMAMSRTIANMKATQIIIPKQYWTSSIQMKLSPMAIPKLISSTEMAVRESAKKLMFVD
jgi:hypothetical protein